MCAPTRTRGLIRTKNPAILTPWLAVVVVLVSATLSGQPLSLLGPGPEPGSLIELWTRLEPAAPPTAGELTLLAKVVLAPGIHLYRHGLRFEWTDLQGVGEPRVDLPPARESHDEWDLVEGDTVGLYEQDFTVTATFPVTGAPGSVLSFRGVLHYQACSDQLCYPPRSVAFAHLATVAAAPSARPPGGRPAFPPSPRPGPDVAEPVEPAPPPIHWLWELVAAFGWGLLVSLTPCVYPMIPITAAVVVGAVAGKAKQSGPSRATLQALVASLVYVLGLSLVYALLGLASASLGAAARGWLESWVVRIPIAVLFVFFALVMFDVVQLALPGGLGARLQQFGARGGYLGLLVVGMGAGLVVSPCLTAPLAALLIRIARTGDRWLGFWSLFSMAWGMGVVLVAAGTFSGSLLPRAGAWMNTVRNLFGFVMLWAVVWVLGPLLGEGPSRVGVGLVVVAGALYLGGLDRLRPESGLAARARKFLGLVALMVGIVYFVVGLAGLLGVDWSPEGERGPGIAFLQADADGLDRALSSGRPVLVDFFTEACVACKEMEATTFRDPEVVAEAARFATLRIDLEAEPGLGDRFAVLGAPTILVFAPGERSPAETLPGKVDAEELLAALRRVP